MNKKGEKTKRCFFIIILFEYFDRFILIDLFSSVVFDRVI